MKADLSASLADPYIVIDSPGKEWHNKPEPGVFPGFGELNVTIG